MTESKEEQLREKIIGLMQRIPCRELRCDFWDSDGNYCFKHPKDNVDCPFYNQVIAFTKEAGYKSPEQIKKLVEEMKELSDEEITCQNVACAVGSRAIDGSCMYHDKRACPVFTAANSAIKAQLQSDKNYLIMKMEEKTDGMSQLQQRIRGGYR